MSWIVSGDVVCANEAASGSDATAGAAISRTVVVEWPSAPEAAAAPSVTAAPTAPAAASIPSVRTRFRSHPVYQGARCVPVVGVKAALSGKAARRAQHLRARLRGVEHE